MDRDKYNSLVQGMQELFPETRFATFYEKDGRIREARFEVFCDGWKWVGTQRRPFSDNSTYSWDDDLELRLRGAFGKAVLS